MNPNTNRFEELVANVPDKLAEDFVEQIKPITPQLFRPNGSPVPDHWSIFQKGEKVVVKNYTFNIAHIGENHMLLEPVGVVKIGSKKPNQRKSARKKRR